MISCPVLSHVSILHWLLLPVRDKIVDHVAIISHIDIEKERGIFAESLPLDRHDRSFPPVSRRALGGVDDALVQARSVNMGGIAVDDIQGAGQIPLADKVALDGLVLWQRVIVPESTAEMVSDLGELVHIRRAGALVVFIDFAVNPDEFGFEFVWWK